MNVRKCTVLIIKRGSMFLVGRIPYSTELRWSISPYDAWKTRERETAEKVARVIGGDLWLFNPVVGQLRETGEKRGWTRTRRLKDLNIAGGMKNAARNADGIGYRNSLGRMDVGENK